MSASFQALAREESTRCSYLRVPVKSSSMGAIPMTSGFFLLLTFGWVFFKFNVKGQGCPSCILLEGLLCS